MKALEVRHAMTKDVVSVEVSSSVLEAARVMRRFHISGVPVLGHGKVVGVLSEKDVARALEIDTPAHLIDLVLDPKGLTESRLKSMREKLSTATVADVMTAEPALIAPEASVETAAQIMRERKINRLPVVEQGRLVGILTRHDVLHAL